MDRYRLASDGLSAAVVGRPDEFHALRSDWESLEARSSASVALSHAFIATALDAMSAGDELAVVTVRDGEVIVGAWPLLTKKRRGLRTATHLGCGSNEEYAGALIEDGPRSAAIAAQAVAAARTVADVINVYNLAAGSPLAEALRREEGLAHRWAMESHVIALQGVESWDAWIKGKSKNFRQARSSERRHLAAKGKLEVRVNAPGVVEWLFAMKRQWLVDRGLWAEWISTPRAEAFFVQLAAIHPWALAVGVTLDDAYIAAGICLQSAGRLEYFITTFDPAYAKHSPGDLLTEECVRIAIERGLDFDFRIMGAFYKDRWANRADLFESVALATTARGAPAVLAMKASAAAKRARVAVGRQVKALRLPQSQRKPR